MSTAGRAGRVVAVIQARMGSTRLPGKVLQHIGRHTMLARVVDRTASIPGVDEVAVATTEAASDDVLADLGDAQGWTTVRGSEADVLDRFVHAAHQTSAGHVVRVCSDCPLLSIAESGRVVARHLETGADYTHNLTVWGSGLPLGTGAEVFTLEALERSSREGHEPHHREHVDEYVYEHPEAFHIEFVEAPPEIARPELRLTVDTPEDLMLVREIYDRLEPSSGMIELADVVALLDREPTLRLINQHVVQKRI